MPRIRQSKHIPAEQPQLQSRPDRPVARYVESEAAAYTHGRNVGQRRAGGRHRVAGWQDRCWRAVGFALQTYMALLAVSATLRTPRERTTIFSDLKTHPGKAISGLTFLQSRMTNNLFNETSQTVSAAFSRYIPPDSAGFSTSGAIVDRIAPTVIGELAGHYLPGKNSVHMVAYQPSGLAKKHLVHEYCHAYTHPEFQNLFSKVVNGRVQSHLLETLFMEAFTDHIADKVKLDDGLHNLILRTWFGSKNGYNAIEIDGIPLKAAVAQVEKIAGEDVLLRAFFSGDPDAIEAVSRASVGVLPRRVCVATATSILENTQNLPPAQRVAVEECIAGASQMFAKDGQLLELGKSHNSNFLVHCKTECARVRDVIGHQRFDQAFYQFDPRSAIKAFKSIERDLTRHWRPWRST